MSSNAMKQQNMRLGQGGARIDKDKAKDYVMNRVIAADLRDSEFWLLIKHVPKNTQTIAGIGLVLNIILPGFGTLLSACMDQKDGVSKVHMFIALLQTLTAVFLIGWIWAIYWSYLIFMESQNDNTTMMPPQNPNMGYAGVDPMGGGNMGPGRMGPGGMGGGPM